MTEQEKQAIRERLELRKSVNRLANIPHPLTDKPWSPFQQVQDDLESLLEALDERDREVERYKESNTVLVISNNDREKENRRLRKALEKIAQYNVIDEQALILQMYAEQALEGEGK